MHNHIGIIELNSPPIILYLVPDLIGKPGGIARYCKMVCHALLNSGVKLEVITLQDSLQAHATASQLFPNMDYSACNGIRKRFMQKAYQMVLHRRPAIILVGHPNFAPLGWSLARLIGARMVTFIYGVDAWYPLPFLRQWSLLHSDQIISISNFTAAKAVESQGIDNNKIRILWNCLDPYFEDTDPINMTSDELVMLTVARINEAEGYKGHDKVIRALPLILPRFPHLIYSIVGDGDGRRALEELANQLGVIHAVCFHGIVSDEELRQHYKRASFFIMPSHREGFGFVFLEAMVNRLPVIGGDIDATSEVVVDKETGLLVNPNSVEAIAKAIECLLSDRELCRRMGEASIRLVQEKFSFRQFQKTLLGHLSELDRVFQ